MLEQHGVRILARNFRTRLGEIDLVGRDGDTIVFIEVRRRSRAGYGSAGESITRTKQRRVIAAAKSYLRRLRAAAPCRFDAVLISDGDVIEWVRGAFIE
jgi:putative endonuclease